MANLIKYDMTDIWASSGDVVAPDSAKIVAGWGVEVVPRQWWNWFENRQDQNIAYMLQKGFPEWDATTEYQINKSYVQHNGTVYKATATSVNSDPTALVSWVKVFADYSVASNALGVLTPLAGMVPYFTSSVAADTFQTTAYGRGLTNVVDAAEARTYISAQTLNTSLTALSSVAPATNLLPYYTGTSSAAGTTLTAFGRSLIDDVDAVSARSTLNVYSTIEVDNALSGGLALKQPLDATLTALAGLATANNTLAYFTATDVATTTTLTPFARSLLDDADATAARATLELVKTTSQTDATAGRMLKVGDFGLGATSLTNSGDANLLRVGGTWSYDTTAGSSNGPASILYGSITQVPFSASGATQFFTKYATGEVFVRASSSSFASWSAWQEVWTSGNLVKQTSASDNTAGRVLLTGAHNLGVAPFAKNVIINGDFNVLQRGGSGSIPVGQYVYTADRWVCDTVGAAVTWSLGGSPEEGYSPGGLVITGAAGNTSTKISQRIEADNCHHLVGKVVTLSFWVYGNGSSSDSVQVILSYPTSKNGFPASNNIQSFTGVAVVNGVWTKYSVTSSALPAGVINGLEVGFVLSAVTAGQSIGVGRVQLEVGSVATPFEHRQYGEELALCQRYYETGGGSGEGFFNGSIATGNSYYYGHIFQVSKRVAPTIAMTMALASGFPSTASTLQGSPTTRGFATQRIANATTSSGLYADNWTASSEL